MTDEPTRNKMSDKVTEKAAEYTEKAKARARDIQSRSKQHLDSVHEDYWQHLAFATRVAATMIAGAILLLIHALIPAVFQCSASKRIFKLADELLARQGKCEGYANLPPVDHIIEL